MEITLRSAIDTDWPRVAGLLQDAQLPLEGAQLHLHNFVLAFQANELVGCAGLERYGDAGLLRSVAVRTRERRAGLGKQLVSEILQAARGGGMRRVLLFTETASDYFPRFGFHLISRAEAPESVKASVEFTSACPDSAIVMMLEIT